MSRWPHLYYNTADTPSDLLHKHWYSLECLNDGIINHSSLHLVLIFEKCKISQVRSSHPKVFLGKGVLKMCSKFTGEHQCRSVILIKLLCSIFAWICCIFPEYIFLTIPLPGCFWPDGNARENVTDMEEMQKARKIGDFDFILKWKRFVSMMKGRDVFRTMWNT